MSAQSLIADLKKLATQSDWCAFTKLLYDHVELTFANKVEKSARSVDCYKGCSFCCSHWVEDVYFYEAVLIYETLLQNMPEKVPLVLEQSAAAELKFESIYHEFYDASELELLHLFYKLDVPCPLLNEKRECSVYDVRPLTCRSFYSENSELFCKPPVKESGVEGTYLVEIDEELQDFLDDVHLTYAKNAPTALRSLLLWVDKNKKN